MSASPFGSRSISWHRDAWRCGPASQPGCLVGRANTSIDGEATEPAERLASGEVGNSCPNFSPQKSCRVSVFEVVLYLSAFREIDSIFTNVGRQIRNSLQISTDEQQFQ